MSKGILLFAHNSPVHDYYSMAEYCAKRIKRFLNLPVSIVTDEESYRPSDLFDKVMFVLPDKSNKNKKEIWINKNRFLAYNYTPYDVTLLLDVDYVVNSDLLLKAFDFVDEISAHRTIQFVNHYKYNQEALSGFSHQLFWATVIVFRKCQKAKHVFDCMAMIQDNYRHYSILHNFLSQQFRNDYALTLAMDIVNGHVVNNKDILPWDLVHVGKNAWIEKLQDTEFKVHFDNVINNKVRKEYIIVKDMDFHLLDKNRYAELIVE